MKANTFLTVIFVIVISCTILTNNSFADVTYNNDPASGSVLNINFNGNFTFVRILCGDITFILTFDGTQLIHYYPEG